MYNSMYPKTEPTILVNKLIGRNSKKAQVQPIGIRKRLVKRDIKSACKSVIVAIKSAEIKNKSAGK